MSKSNAAKKTMNASSDLPFDIPEEFRKKAATPDIVAKSFQEANEAVKKFMKNKKKKNKEAALAAVQTLEEVAPNMPATQELAGKFYLGAAMIVECLEAFNRLNLLVPNNPDILHATTVVYEKLHMYLEAMQFIDYAIEIKPNEPTLLAKGWRIAAMFDLDKVSTYLTRYIKLRPNCPIGLVGLCTHQIRTGDIKGAKETVKLIEERAPDTPMLLYVKGRIAKVAKHYEEALELLEEYLTTDSDTLKMEATSELADLYERAGRIDDAYEYFRQSNRLMQERPQSKLANGARTNDTITIHKYWYAQQDWVDTLPKLEKPQDHYRTPIYILGFPRSGTTLLEQVITTMPDVVSSQEAGLLDNTIAEISKILGRPVPGYPRDMNQLSQEDLLKLRQHYFIRAEFALGEPIKEDQWLLDKQPYSALYAGLIPQIFPDAKVIFLKRDPRSCILSCFKQNFVPNNMSANFWEFDNTVDNYIHFMELWLEYERTLPLDFLVMRYEDMVSDFESHARKVCDFMEKPWDDKILRYYEHKQKRGVRTPSYTGVNKPMYTQAIAKWKPWEKYFEPHKEKLLPIMERLGYEW